MNRSVILMYHLVDHAQSERERRFCTPPGEFRRQMEWLIRAGYQPVALGDIAAGRERAVHITFDDGFACVLEHAAPVLREFGLPATMFAVSGRLGRTNDWMTERGFPERPLLSAEGLHTLREFGFSIGSHTRSHARLTDLDPVAAHDEIAGSKTELEDRLGVEVRYFAYPYGKENPLVRDLVVDSGYAGACSTRSGFNRPGDDSFLLRRIDIFGTDRLWQFRQKIAWGINEASRLYPLKYYRGRIAARIGRT